METAFVMMVLTLPKRRRGLVLRELRPLRSAGHRCREESHETQKVLYGCVSRNLAQTLNTTVFIMTRKKTTPSMRNRKDALASMGYGIITVESLFLYACQLFC